MPIYLISITLAFEIAIIKHCRLPTCTQRVPIFKFCMNILVFRYNISFIDPPLGGFGEIFPEVMIFPEGFSPREISSLQEIFHRIPLAPGL